MSRIVFDAPPWWQRPGWQLASATVLAGVAGVIWWTALTPIDHDPIVVRTPPAPTVMARSAPPAPAATVAPAAPPVVVAPAAPPVVVPPAIAEPSPPPAALPLSRMVAPGMQVTPRSLPPGMLVPAETQTEENLEN